jgi:hypothetical protein
MCSGGACREGNHVDRRAARTLFDAHARSDRSWYTRLAWTKDHGLTPSMRTSRIAVNEGH